MIGSLILVAIGFALGWVFTGLMYSQAVQATQARWEEAERKNAEADQALQELAELRSGARSDAWRAGYHSKQRAREAAALITAEQDRREEAFHQANQGEQDG